MKKTIIWDFNGTLLADAQLSVDTDNAVFDQLGLPHITLDDYRRHMTMPVRNFYTALGVDLNVYPYETISRIWLDAFNAQAVAAGLVPGALAAIEALNARGHAQAVLSASYEPSLRAQCDALGLTPLMRAVNGHQDEGANKKTDIGRKQLDALGISGADAILVGDMVADAELARELGMACVLVSWGHNDVSRLEKTGCPIAHDFDELLQFIDSLS